ncbi:hypothetical protein KAR52_03135 [Candidatus Pacearchaeota archaeon]|nr:hypothetical protein [Candidatus Pacearchaeota archaeon]
MCKKCETNPVYEFTNKKKLCGNCFIKYFQKKVLYTIRKFGLIKKDEIIWYEKGNDFRQVVLESILKLFEDKLRIKLLKLPSKKKKNKIAIALNIDSQANKIIQTLIYGKVSELKKVSPIKKTKNNIFIKPLYLFLDKEILLYAKLKKLKFAKVGTEKTALSEFIEELEKKHPEIKRAVVNSYLELYN